MGRSKKGIPEGAGAVVAPKAGGIGRKAAARLAEAALARAILIYGEAGPRYEPLRVSRETQIYYIFDANQIGDFMNQWLGVPTGVAVDKMNGHTEIMRYWSDIFGIYD